MRTTVGPLLLAATFLLLARAAHGCLWDRDTAEEEAKRAGRIDLEGEMVEVIDIITGRFARNPPLYYVMRLERVTAELARTPDALGLYDDAAVACDRLGRHDEAIGWMEKKRAALDGGAHAEPGRSEHEYRYLANLGTFHAHRWARNGASGAERADLERAEELIAEAIALNPDAHFGREEYQLRAIQWLLNRGLGTDELEETFVSRSEFNLIPHEKLGETIRRALDGTAGLVSLGIGWESVDVFGAIGIVLTRRHDSSLALLTWLRLEELYAAGKRSLHPLPAIRNRDYPPRGALPFGLEDGDKAEVKRLFRRLRVAADAWHAARTEFMMSRLQAGRHPDIDPEFWVGYREAKRPSLDLSLVRRAGRMIERPTESIIAWSVVGLGAVMIGAAIRWRRRVARERKR